MGLRPPGLCLALFLGLGTWDLPPNALRLWAYQTRGEFRLAPLAPKPGRRRGKRSPVGAVKLSGKRDPDSWAV